MAFHQVLLAAHGSAVQNLLVGFSIQFGVCAEYPSVSVDTMFQVFWNYFGPTV